MFLRRPWQDLTAHQGAQFGNRWVIDFQHFVINIQKTGDFSLNSIGNMNKTPIGFDMPCNKTLNQKSDKTVFIKITGDEKTILQ